MGFYGPSEQDVGGINGSPDYRGIGAAAARRQAYQVDFGKSAADEAQGLDMRAQQEAGLNNMRQAAMGGAPSQAAILGGQSAGQSLEAQMAAAANGRGGVMTKGGIGLAAAQQQAAQQAQAQQLGAVQQFTGMRGNEMAHAQSAYGGAAGAMRQGDYAQQAMAQQRAEAQARAEQTQRELNQAAQMGYEQMDVRNKQAQSESELRQKGIHSKEDNTRDSREDQEQSRMGKWVKTGAAVAGSIASMFSDERTKEDVRPVSMAHLVSRLDPHERAALTSGKSRHEIEWNRSRGNDSASGMSDEQDEQNNPQPYDDEATEAMNGPTNAPRTMLSDDHTKLVAAQREAFTAGLAHANQAADTGTIGEAPPYMREAPSTEKRQPAAKDARAASTTVAKQDGAHQRDVVRASSQDLARAAVMTNPVMPLSVQMGGELMRGDVEGRSLAMRQRAQAPASLPPIEPSASYSDERTKEDTHAEKDMGAALEQGFRPFEYEYKPEFADAEGQERGERNVGPMAQDMARNSITGSAVKKRPDGLLVVDIPKATKVNSAGIGYLAARQRELEAQIASMKKGAR